MSPQNGTTGSAPDHIDYDIHGLVGIRLLQPTAAEAAAVARQLGPLRAPLQRAPDLTIRFVDQLPTPGLRLLGLEKNGYTRDGFFILRSGKKRAKVRLDFAQIGGACEIVCERGIAAVPLLLAIVNLTALQKDCVALHASAFVYQETGIIVTGWAKGGKTETLLAFAQHGARYVGDEWILLRGDGREMYGVPENLRLWDWHLEHLPGLRRRVKREHRLRFKAIHALDRLQHKWPRGAGKFLPVKYLREAMPALKRQLNVTLPAATIFGERCGPFSARPEKIFLVASHDLPQTRVEQVAPQEIADRVIASIQYELLPFMEHYLAFAFAFPERRNRFIEQATQRQAEILRRALAGLEAYAVWHPYPFSFEELYQRMKPFCEKSAAAVQQ
ncbi:MAG: hypothetical protein ONB48_15630 [candidate division KSB1 bacterium]|nr:hypothetical protein [candidate division KSB1 bacterium]MDZ7276143.1 hypothetical protein [candidate division KSB1 bacterium]MDZ7287077.1 hypothetical protein [candidate division KSB1 bacterium]MDZ7296998.1 hypothetical protein [candidate division KSB1 bacterium]MDZ7306172.1 hypothetical protein [candidate division KSB1 bacterium]